jgi:very-short-patch-repair endonuclease
MPHRTPLPEELCGAAFTVARARQLQVGRGRLASRDLFRPFHGIRTGEAPVGVLARCRAYQAKLGSNMSFSHLTAAVVLGIPLMWGLEKLDVLHVTTFGGRPARGRGITGHKSSRSMLPYTVGDVRVTDPVQTYFDLATMVSHKWLVVAGDALIGGEHPLCTLEELRTAVTLRAGARGTERARRALMRVRLRVDSPMETLLRLLLVDAALIEPIVNRRYWAATGMYLGKADLSYPQWRIAIEYEGEQHRVDPNRFAEDIRRRARFTSAEWTVIRVEKSGLLEHPGEILRVVRGHIATQQRRIADGFLIPVPLPSAK